MPYQISNLIMTRHDPLKRGNKPFLARRPITIGQRIIKPGETITIGDHVYEQVKSKLAVYETQGLIKINRLPNTVSPTFEPSLLEDQATMVTVADVVLLVDPPVDDAVVISTESVIADNVESPAPAAEVTSTEETSEQADVSASAESATEEQVAEEPVQEEVRVVKRRRTTV